MGRYFSATDISASGLAAERLRMEIVASNLANAQTTRTPEGGPYRRREVVFSSIYDDVARAPGDVPLGGVRVLGMQGDPSDFPRVYRPGHPDADTDGFVLMPNVNTATEMVDMMTASRAYEANLRALRSFRDMTESVLSLLRQS
ncbi:MAG: flagellar basal body rod protein FlgC [Planctomycetales bacterium]|nr:flagellar basal body rod protein FlgC [Planctomycetales bacterium]